jgi:hypothetical protein
MRWESGIHCKWKLTMDCCKLPHAFIYNDGWTTIILGCAFKRHTNFGVAYQAGTDNEIKADIEKIFGGGSA